MFSDATTTNKKQQENPRIKMKMLGVVSSFQTVTNPKIFGNCFKLQQRRL